MHQAPIAHLPRGVGERLRVHPSGHPFQESALAPRVEISVRRADPLQTQTRRHAAADREHSQHLVGAVLWRRHPSIM